MSDSPYLPQYDPQNLTHKLHNASYWQLIADATPRSEGGFIAGITWPGNEFLGMVQMGSLALGTRARCDGHVYTVRGNQLLERDDGLLFRTTATQPVSLHAVDDYRRVPRGKTYPPASARNPREIYTGRVPMFETGRGVPGEPGADPPHSQRAGLEIGTRD